MSKEFYLIEYYRDIERIMNFISKFPDIEIWIIAKNGIIAKAYWKGLKTYIGKEPFIFTSNVKAIDGLNPDKAMILLCGLWWKNPVAQTEVFNKYLKQARFTMGIWDMVPKRSCIKFTEEGLQEFIKNSEYLQRAMKEME